MDGRQMFMQLAPIPDKNNCQTNTILRGEF